MPFVGTLEVLDSNGGQDPIAMHGMFSRSTMADASSSISSYATI